MGRVENKAGQAVRGKRLIGDGAHMSKSAQNWIGPQGPVDTGPNPLFSECGLFDSFISNVCFPLKLIKVAITSCFIAGCCGQALE